MSVLYFPILFLFLVGWTVYRFKEDNTQMFGDSIIKIYTYEKFNDLFLLHKRLSVITNSLFIVFIANG